MGRSWSFAAWFGLDRIGASQRSTGSFRFDQVEFRNCQGCSSSVRVGSGVVGFCLVRSRMVLLGVFQSILGQYWSSVACCGQVQSKGCLDREVVVGFGLFIGGSC